MRLLFFIFLVFISPFILAQDVDLQGFVKDQENQALEMANVIALDENTGNMASYSVTTEKGFFKLNLKANKKYTIRVSYIGYETQNKSLETSDGQENISLDFVLVEKRSELEGVELTYEMPITIKGDTIVYRADAFTTGEEKKLGDVLEKLPGVEINDAGDIEVEGTKVSKVMVEGKDFFDGDSKLAQKNIPADAVKKVEVLKNYNEVFQMRGLENDEDAIALNVRLKEGKESFWFGEITAGGNAEGNYLIHPKLFYYSPKKSLNILTDFNDIGDVPFTFTDYFKFSGGFKNIMRKGGSSIRLSSEQLGFSFLPNNRAQAIVSRFAALNFNYSVKEKLDLSGFAIYNNNDTDMRTEYTQTYTASRITDHKTNTSLQKNRLGMLKLSAKYNPHTNFQMDYDIIVKGSEQTEIFHTNSTRDGIIDTNREQKPFSINQNLNLYYTLSEKHIFSGAIQYLYDKNTPLYNATSVNEFFEQSTLLQLQKEELFDITQNKSKTSTKWDAKIDYFYVLNKTSNLNFTLGNTYTLQSLDSHIFQTLDNNTTYDFTDKLLNNTTALKYNDLFLAVRYNLLFGKLSITPGFSIHQYQLKDIQGNTQTQFLNRILPHFFAKYQFKRSRSLRFEYDITSEYADIGKFASGLLLANYNSLSGGNRAIESALYHNYSLQYAYFNMFNHTNMFASINYNKRKNTIKTNTDVVEMETDRITYPINMTTPDKNISGFINYDRRFRKFKIEASINYNWGKNYSFVNDAESLSKSFSQNYKLSFSTRFKDAPNLTIGYELNLNDYTSHTVESRYITDKPFVDIEVPFLKNFVWTADYSYHNYRNNDGSTENKYTFLSSKLYYQKQNSPWEFILSATNLFQTKSIDENSASDILISNSRYFVQPNYYLLTVKYNL